MAKISDFEYMKTFGYLKISKVLMTYKQENYEELYIMFKAAKKFAMPARIIERIHQRYNKLRLLQERKEMFK